MPGKQTQNLGASLTVFTKVPADVLDFTLRGRSLYVYVESDVVKSCTLFELPENAVSVEVKLKSVIITLK